MINIAEMIGMGQNNIFFIEAEESLTEFHPRLLCAFESAALHNPDHLVISNILYFIWLCELLSRFSMATIYYFPQRSHAGQGFLFVMSADKVIFDS